MNHTDELLAKIKELRDWKEKTLPYLEDLMKLQQLVGNHSYASTFGTFNKKEMLRYRTVCTLKQAKRLKELGVLQNSNIYWEVMRQPVIEGCASERLSYIFNMGHPLSASVVESNYSAFDTAELGVMFPVEFGSKNDLEGWKVFVKKSHVVGLDIDGEFHGVISDTSEAEARAGLLIDLVDRGVISVDRINSRLLESDEQ